MTDGAYAPPCGRLHSDKVLALINKFVYHVHMALFGSVRIPLTSPQSVKSGLRLVALIARTNGPSHQRELNTEAKADDVTASTICF